MRRGLVERLASWDAFLAVLTAATLTYAAIAVPNFATAFNISQAIAGVSERALIVLPMVLLIIAREIDLSVASMLALSSVVFGVAVQAGAGISLAILAALLTGLVGGALNGALVTLLGLPSLVVTLGTLALFRGVGYIILGSGSVNEFPDAFTDFGIDTVGGSVLPWTIVPFLILAPIFAVLLQKSAIGRRIYAIGGNPDVARYAGVRVGRIRLALFATSGVISALAGVVFYGAACQCAGGQRGRPRARRDHHRAARRRQRVRRQGPSDRRILCPCVDRGSAQHPRVAADRRRCARHGHRAAPDRIVAPQHRDAAALRLGERLSGFARLWRLQTGRSAGGQIQPDHRRLDGENGGDDNMRASYIIAALFVGTAARGFFLSGRRPGYGRVSSQARYRSLFSGRKDGRRGSPEGDWRQGCAGSALAGDRRGADPIYQHPRLAESGRDRHRRQRRQCRGARPQARGLSRA